MAYDPGRFYPHHKVYGIVCEARDLRARQTLLRSDFVTRQIRAHAVARRGGAVRCRTQTLRKLRLPAAAALPPNLIAEPAALAESGDAAHIDAAAKRAFGGFA